MSGSAPTPALVYWAYSVVPMPDFWYGMGEVENLINLHIAKQRNGPTGRCQMIFDRAIQRFGDFASYGDDDGPPPPPVDFDPPDAAADAIYGDDEDEVPF